MVLRGLKRGLKFRMMLTHEPLQRSLTEAQHPRRQRKNLIQQLITCLREKRGWGNPAVTLTWGSLPSPSQRTGSFFITNGWCPGRQSSNRDVAAAGPCPPSQPPRQTAEQAADTHGREAGTQHEPVHRPASFSSVWLDDASGQLVKCLNYGRPEEKH